MLLLRELDADRLLADPGVERDLGPGDRARLDAQDLEGALVQGRGDLHDERLRRGQLAGQAVPLAHQVVAQLELVVDRAGRRDALDHLDPAGGAAPAPAAGGRDVDALGVGGPEQDGTRLDVDGPPIGQDGDGDG